MAIAKRHFEIAGALRAGAAAVVLTSIVAAFSGPFLAAFLPPQSNAGAQPWTRDPVTPFVTVRDGRNLSFQVYGAEEGRHLCFWFHGTPSCRLEAHGLSPELLEDLDIKVVAVDRPGYGQSDPHPGRTYASFADDIAQMADQLGFQRFYVAGMSGGGPYALAALSYMPLRVQGAVVNSAAGSWGALTEAERAELPLRPLQAFAVRALTAASQRYSFREAFKWVAATRGVSQWVYTHLSSRLLTVVEHMSDNDRLCLQQPPRFFEVAVIPETLRQHSAAAWIEDHILFFNPWSFNPAAMPQQQASRIIITHGRNDSIVNYTFSKALKRMMPASHLHIVQDGGHVDYWWCSIEYQRLTFEALLQQEAATDDSAL